MSSLMTLLAKRRFGQHFLRDTAILNRVVQFIQPRTDDVIIEIGAGTGFLTTRLAPHVARLIAVEVDRDCIAALRQALAYYPQASIVAGDILGIDLPSILPHLRHGHRLRAVGNLPYNIATAIIDKLFSADLPLLDMVFMVQLEVAERIVALPRSREYGYLSVRCQHASDARIQFKVPPSSFVPRPKVQSAVISLRPKSAQGAPFSESTFLELTKAAFAYRRKTLSNSLLRNPSLGDLAARMLYLAGIDGQRRAQELTVGEYELLAAHLDAVRGKG